jgi:hypothetical protein
MLGDGRFQPQSERRRRTNSSHARWASDDEKSLNEGDFPLFTIAAAQSANAGRVLRSGRPAGVATRLLLAAEMR